MVLQFELKPGSGCVLLLAYAADLFFGKAEPFPFARGDASSNCYVVKVFGIVFIVARQIGRARRLVDFLDNPFFLLGIARDRGLFFIGAPARQVFVP